MAARENADVTDVVADWEKFLKRRYNKKERIELAKEFPHKRSLYIDYHNLEAFGRKGLALADQVVAKPEKVMADVKDALVRLGIIGEKDRRRVHVRFTNLTRKTKIRDIRSNQINTFVAVEGILRKTTEVRPRITAAVFRCLECGQLTPPYSQSYRKFQEPFRVCAQCQKKTPLELVPEHSTFVDAQKLRIQESPEGLRGGEQPQTIDVDVTDDLTGSSAPGDRVVVNGILRSVQRVNGSTKSTLFDIYVECNSVEVAEKEFEEVNISEEDEAAIQELSQDEKIYSKIARSIAPTIYGNTDVKEAVALQLFGGIPKEMPDGSRLRGDIHMLLVGDPGIAKSQLLRYIVQLSPRGIYTSGKSSTSAGLTATAVKDEFGDGRWTLEAGALVLADMGMAAVDELDKMDKEDRSALHEAMEQQTVSIAKAGITATLKSRCALLGAANPKMGRFDEYAPIAEQINMPPSLLSRFDLIFIMTDKPDSTLDMAIAEHILKSHSVGELIEKKRRMPVEGVDDAYIEQQLRPVTPDIDPLLFRKYIAYAKRNCFPTITPEARNALRDYYLTLRNLADTNKPVPVTARQLEALVRLGEASARIRLSETVEIEDAERVIKIVDTCLRQVAYDAESGTFDIDKWTTGISKQQRDIVRTVKEVIRDLGGEDGLANLEQVVEEMLKQSFPKEKIEAAIKMLRNQGEVVETRPGVVRLLERDY
ncbi:replicative DNA helicase Mcm [Methanofollis sp. W23]|uniref:minichromosome maintenance protein MCM n=1 Tax=Methanofollis sp. W23 TaxID=2817849 RepID=UPI001AE3C697|nr:minichromosome maintenance protein MCM [Methanofollis sp. W23]MBP2144969.1 replicative DNA helicase Mcm [Methanofollis sp. W23]